MYECMKILVVASVNTGRLPQSQSPLFSETESLKKPGSLCCCFPAPRLLFTLTVPEPEKLNAGPHPGSGSLRLNCLTSPHDHFCPFTVPASSPVRAKLEVPSVKMEGCHPTPRGEATA